MNRLVQIQLADRIAILIWFCPFNAFAALAGRHFFVPFPLALAKVGENFHQRLALHSPDGLGRKARPAFAVLVQHSLFQQLLEHL